MIERRHVAADRSDAPVEQHTFDKKDLFIKKGALMLGSRHFVEKSKRRLLSSASLASYAVIGARGPSLSWVEARAEDAQPANGARPAENAQIDDRIS